MFDWLIELVKWAYREFWPIRIVHSFEQGVRFHRGQDEALLKTGIHWFWPGTGSISIECVVDDVCLLPIQTLTTKDDITVTLAGSVAYRIRNVRHWHTRVTDFHDSMVGICTRHLMRSGRNATYKQLSTGQDQLEEELKAKLEQAVGNWGVKILDVGLTSFSKTPTLRIYGTLPQAQDHV